MMTESNNPSPITKLVLGADHAGYALKQVVAEHLRARGIEVADVGCFNSDSVDYPAIAEKLALAVQELQQTHPEQSHAGILCCGSGIGICISANRFPWIRAVEAHDHNTVLLSRQHNHSNVLCLGGRVVAPPLACNLVDAWLQTEFEGGRHQRRVDMMTDLQQQTLNASKEVSQC